MMQSNLRGSMYLSLLLDDPVVFVFSIHLGFILDCDEAVFEDTFNMLEMLIL